MMSGEAIGLRAAPPPTWRARFVVTPRSFCRLDAVLFRPLFFMRRPLFCSRLPAQPHATVVLAPTAATAEPAADGARHRAPAMWAELVAPARVAADEDDEDCEARHVRDRRREPLHRPMLGQPDEGRNRRRACRVVLGVL